MKLPLLFVTIFIVRANSVYQIPTLDNCIDNEADAKRYVESLSDGFDNTTMAMDYARWDYEADTSIGDSELDRKKLAYRMFAKASGSRLETFCWNNFNDKNLVRLATQYFIRADKVTPAIFNQYFKLRNGMRDLYQKTKLCKFEDRLDTNCIGELEMEPDLIETMAKIRNHDQLKYYWTKWHDVVGNGVKDLYNNITKIRKAADKLMGFKDPGERQIRIYERDDFPSLMRDAYSKPFTFHGETLSLEIFYKEIHTYVKGKLMERYNKQGAGIQNDGPIPAHLLGDMIAKNWKNIIDLALPFPDASATINVTEKLLENDKTVEDIVQMADDFFSGLGFNPMTPKFWKLSVFEKPKDSTNFRCGLGSAWNLNNNDDFRIKICAKVEEKDYLKIYEKMTDIVFDNEIKHLPYGFRERVNKGIRKALSGLMGLAVRTPSYLSRVCLLDGNDDSTNNNDIIRIQGVEHKKSDINYMMRVALEKIVHLPYSLARDSWRWRYFSGKISESNLNGEFWKIVKDLQGLEPPVDRDETNFDIGADYHIIFLDPLIHSYFSFIGQFQFYEALCKESNQYDPDSPDIKPLHLCDFSKGGERIGNILKAATGKGISVPWTEIMKKITGTDKLSGESLVKYFLPLYRYLKDQNEKGNITPWKSSK